MSDAVHYAWPYIRMNADYNVDHSGTITNSEGQINQEGTNEQVADWVDYCNLVGDWREGNAEGITIFSHDDNTKPHKWLTRDYGCFGPRRDDERSGKKFTLKKGESMKWRGGDPGAQGQCDDRQGGRAICTVHSGRAIARLFRPVSDKKKSRIRKPDTGFFFSDSITGSSVHDRDLYRIRRKIVGIGHGKREVHDQAHRSRRKRSGRVQDGRACALGHPGGPMKFVKMVVFRKVITRLVKASQLRGRVASPPGRGMPGLVPVTPPRMM